MTLAEGIFSYLAGRTDALDRVYPTKLPPGCQLPAMTWRVIPGSGPVVSHSDVHDGSPGERIRWETTRVQVDCWGPTELLAETLGEQLLHEVHGFRGFWGSVQIGYALEEGGTDDYDSDVGTFRRVIDFMIRYKAGGDGGS